MIDKRYIAGFIDGEGCFNIARDRKTYFPRLLIGNTNIEVLKAIKNIYGGDIQIVHSKMKNSRPSGMYRAAGKSFRKILSDVHKFLIVKKPQADLCIEMIKTTNRDARFEIKQRMHLLNKKGLCIFG